LLRGGHQVVLPHFEVEAILEALQRHSRISMFAAPTMLTRLVHAPAVASADLGNLRTIFYGGGPMYVAELDRALQPTRSPGSSPRAARPPARQEVRRANSR
jgi:acyl-CoA synthetase (AMP-forming)/AMP-acid ligase II